MPKTSNENNWNDCSPGELTSLGKRLRAEQRRSQARSLLPIVACAVLLAATSIAWLVTPDQPLGGITCSVCHSNFTAYHAHLTGENELENKLANSMQAHLAECPACRALYEQQFPGELVAALQESGRLLAHRNTQLAWSLLAAPRF